MTLFLTAVVRMALDIGRKGSLMEIFTKRFGRWESRYSRVCVSCLSVSLSVSLDQSPVSSLSRSPFHGRDFLSCSVTFVFAFDCRLRLLPLQFCLFLFFVVA